MKQTRTFVSIRRDARHVKSDDRSSVQIGIVAAHASQGPLVDIRVIAAAFAAMALTGGAAGTQNGGGESNRLGGRLLDQPIRPFGDAQGAQRLDEVPLQRLDPGGWRRLQRFTQHRHDHDDGIGHLESSVGGGSVERYQPSPANQTVGPRGGWRVNDRTWSLPPRRNTWVRRAAVTGSRRPAQLMNPQPDKNRAAKPRPPRSTRSMPPHRSSPVRGNTKRPPSRSVSSQNG